MKYIKEMVNENITPTPGAVMEAFKLLYKNIGDLLTLDVGGVTTDVHLLQMEVTILIKFWLILNLLQREVLRGI